MSRSLAQALEGITFPCDRSRLIEYARTNDAMPKAMESLSAIPERQYRDMTEVLSAIPSKRQMRKRPAVQTDQPVPAPRPVERGEVKAERQPAGESSRLADELWPDRAQPAPMEWWTAGWTLASNFVRTWQRFWFPWIR